MSSYYLIKVLGGGCGWKLQLVPWLLRERYESLRSWQALFITHLTKDNKIYRFKRFMIHSNVNEFIRIELLDFFAKYSEFWRETGTRGPSKRFFWKMVLYEKILRIIRNFDATFNELLDFDVLFEGWKVKTSVDLLWTCLGWFSSKVLECINIVVEGKIAIFWGLNRNFFSA